MEPVWTDDDIESQVKAYCLSLNTGCPEPNKEGILDVISVLSL